MRHPMNHVTESRFGGDQRTGYMQLDLHTLDQLLERAGAFVVEREVAATVDVLDHPARDLGYAEGVKAALGWIAGHHADDRLTELLDIDEDQR